MKTPSPLIQRLEQALALSPLVATVWLAFSPLPANAGLTDIAPAPLANSSSAVVKPNILMILDDSGSMNSEFMPDYVADSDGTWCKKATNSTSGQTLVSCDEGDVPFYAAAFNGLAYNPTVRYLPAINADTTSKTSYNTSALWQAVPADAYGIQFSGAITDLTQNFPDIMFCQDSSSTSDRTAPYFSGVCKHALAMGTGTQAWTYPDGDFSNRVSVRLSSDPLLARAPYYYTIASVLWCSSKDGLGFGSGSCQAKKTSTFKWPQYGAISRTDIVQNEVTSKYTYVITTDAACTSGAGNNFCGTGSIFTCASGRFRKQTTTTSALRTIVTRGARVISDSGVPASGSFGSPVVTYSGSCGTNSSGTSGSGNLGFQSPNPSARTLSSTTATTQTTTPLTYPKTTGRSDCSGAVGGTGCSFTEEMTNFANWYAYYRSRMQMMKTASGLAFKTINQNYRVGFITINPGSNIGSSKYLAIAPFEGAQRTSWYDVFYKQNPSPTTPLRQALARAGRYFAGKGPSDTAAASGLNRGMNDDPIQYSCQQNFAILSTDGLWNDSDSVAVSIDGSTKVGNSDGNLTSAPRPMFDGTQTTDKTTTTTTSQILCTGNEQVFGGPSTCGCADNLKRVMQNASASTEAVAKLGGVAQSSVTTVVPNVTSITTCNAKQIGTKTPQTSTEIVFCKRGTNGSVATFSDGQTVSCSGCSGSAGFLVRQKNSRTKSDISFDGGPVVSTVSIDSTDYDYFANNSWVTSKPTSSGTSSSRCTTGTLTGTALSVSNGTPVVPVNTGTSRTTADFTLGPTATPPTSPYPKVDVGATTSTTNVGTFNTLADVAQYYYITDLRGGTDAFGNPTGPATSPATTPTAGGDISENNVKGQTAGSDVQNDSAVHQHMTTFTVGLGVDGTLTYASDYKENASGDFLLIKNGTNTWPAPVSNTDTTVDDLWHAGVNGRGKYLSARDPSQLSTGLQEALTSVNAVVGAAAAAATSNLEPVAGDNFAYIASYETVRWNGEVQARTIDLNTGAVSSTDVWSAQAQLDTLANATTPGGGNRKIWRLKSGAIPITGTGGNLEAFLYSNFDATEQSYFQAAHVGGADGVSYPALTQWTSLDATTQRPLAVETNLVNFIRGDGSFENNTSVAVTNRVFRDRAHVLGDIVNAQPVFVKKSSLGYNDANYAAFKACINDGGSAGSCDPITGTDVARPAIVYISSNDGMLHALNGDTGAENWAYIPNMLMPKLYRLADNDYKTAINHQWMVDGSPTVGDIFDGTKWRTILVGGLNGGERGYYALDITNPAKPIGLWELKARSTSCTFAVNDTTDCDLGYSYGNPIITKLGDGTWVVMIPSGYNNVNPGDGKGYLYVVEPTSGKIKKKIGLCSTTPQSPSICPGDTTTPVGFAKINNWVDDSSTNNTTLRVYGGDLAGNIWRINADTGVAYVIASATDGAATPAAQPITTRPELGQVTGSSGTADMVYIGTGQYLGTGDTSTTQKQTIYAIKDSSNGVAPVTPIDLRGSTMKSQTLQDTTDATGVAVRTVTNTPVDVTSATVDGWRVDLPVSGERVNIDPKLQLGTLIVGSNVPANNACNAGGFSFLNFFDYRTGSYIPSSGSNIAGQRIGNSLLVGINVVRLPNNKTVAIATTSDNQHPTLYPPFQSPNPVGRRVGWRELSD